MINIKFYPKSDELNLVKAVKEYRDIWEQEGEKFITVIERISNLKFKDREIESCVYEGKSTSHPLQLRASYPIEIKKATLIHELCHILLTDNDIKGDSLEIYKRINPILFNTWVDLYGEDFANRMVEEEIKKGKIYEKAWEGSRI